MLCQVFNVISSLISFYVIFFCFLSFHFQFISYILLFMHVLVPFVALGLLFGNEWRLYRLNMFYNCVIFYAKLKKMDMSHYALLLRILLRMLLRL